MQMNQPLDFGGQEPPKSSIFRVFCCFIYDISSNSKQKRRCLAAELNMAGLSHFNETARYILRLIYTASSPPDSSTITKVVTTISSYGSGTNSPGLKQDMIRMPR